MTERFDFRLRLLEANTQLPLFLPSLHLYYIHLSLTLSTHIISSFLSSIPLSPTAMARNPIFSRRRRSDQLDALDRFPTSDSEVHVLAVDDSLVDRTVIERLLRLTACRGLSLCLLPLFNYVLFLFLCKFILCSVFGIRSYCS